MEESPCCCTSSAAGSWPTPLGRRAESELGVRELGWDMDPDSDGGRENVPTDGSCEPRLFADCGLSGAREFDKVRGSVLPSSVWCDGALYV